MSTEPKRIVLAEDEEHIAKMILFKLSKAGYQVIWMNDGQKALQEITQNPPDLAILDVMMPILTGFDVLKALKENPQTQAVPVLMLTARSQEGDKMQGFDLGATDYMTKPFSPAELAARIARILG